MNKFIAFLKVQVEKIQLKVSKFFDENKDTNNLKLVMNHIKFKMGLLEIKFSKENKDAKIPSYKTVGAAGFDFICNEDVSIPAGGRRLISTGVMAEVPLGFELRVQSRSSISKTPLMLANGIGCVDSDYRGVIYLAFFNTSENAYEVKKGDRLAQGVISPATQLKIKEVKELSKTERGSGGFGSTGKN
jgi:dUTP pyrophosphatase